jgi:2-methylcitrate dehydratase PrpD
MTTHDPSQHEAPDFAEIFADFAAGVTLQDLPQEVIAMAETDIFDTLACAIAGFDAPGVAGLRDRIADWGGKPEAGIWCTGMRVPAHHAAWINGMMAHARDFDDSHDTATLHAGVSVVPAALAAADLCPTATGADVVAGVAVGLELASRMGLATTVSVLDSGYLYTSLYGHFAATAAAARVMGLDSAATANALGIAYSQAAGTHQVTRDGALTKRMQPGFAAKTALISVALATAGIRGTRRTFEGADGLFRTYLHGNFRPERLREGLGSTYDLLGLSYKMYPCCRWTHAAIDGAFALRQRIAPQSIRRLTVHANRILHEVVGTPLDTCQAPRTTVQAQFSIPYTVACGLLRGRVDLHDFTEDGITDPDVRALAAKIEVVIDPVLDAGWPRTMSPVRLVAETGHEQVEIRIDHPRGSTGRPMSAADFTDKMAGCLRHSAFDWPAGTATRFGQVISGLRHAPDAADLLGLIGRPPSGRTSGQAVA